LFVNLEKVSQTLNIKLNSLFKVLTRCGFSRSLFLSKNQTLTLIDCLSSKKSRYENKRLINALNNEMERL
jgi:hypothetical protein